MGEEAKRSLFELVRYGIVGIASNLAAYLVFLFLTRMGVGPKLSMSLVYLAAVSFGFLGHKNWTFSQEGAWLSSGSRYALAHFLGYLFNFFILMVFVDYGGLSHEWVQAVAIFVVAGFLFLSFKFFVFAESKKPEAEAQ